MPVTSATMTPVSHMLPSWEHGVRLPGRIPYIGKQDEISCEAELKVEVTILAEKLMETVAAVKTVHPYEEPVINVIPLIGIGI